MRWRDRAGVGKGAEGKAGGAVRRSAGGLRGVVQEG